MDVMYGPTLVQHFLISLVPWLVGVIIGSGMGYACALLVRRLLTALPGLRRPSMLLPWRTVAVTLLLLSPAVPVFVGLEMVAGGVIVGLFVLLSALPFTVVTLLDHWYGSPVLLRLSGGARTLAAASVAVASVTITVGGGGGAGWLIFEGMRLLDYPAMLRGFSIVFLLALMSDILLGALQLLSSYTSKEPGAIQRAVE